MLNYRLLHFPHARDDMTFFKARGFGVQPARYGLAAAPHYLLWMAGCCTKFDCVSEQ